MADDLDRLDELLSGQEKVIRDAFFAYVANMRDPKTVQEIITLLENRDVAGAMRIVDSHIGRFANVIPTVFQNVGTVTAAELEVIVSAAVLLDAAAAARTETLIPSAFTPYSPPAPQLPSLPSPSTATGVPPTPPRPPGTPPVAAPSASVGISFDPTHPRAAELIRQHRLQFVRDFTDGQRAAVQQALNRSMLTGSGPEQTAREFRDSIGLTGYQESAVANYRRLLENRDRQALQRDLRDRRSDRTVERAIERNRPLTPKQIDSMVDRYRRNYLQLRAETIARTEGTQATAEARDESLAQMIEQTGIDEARVEEMWNVTRDVHTRDWHRSMQGQTVPYGGMFTDGLGNRLRRPGDPSAPANTRINCRCGKTFRIAPAA